MNPRVWAPSRERARLASITLILAAGSEGDGERLYRRAAIVSSPLAFHHLLSIPGMFRNADFAFASALQAPSWCIVADTVDLDQARPSPRANIITTTSSSKTPKNPIQWRSKLGDRHRLLQLRPPSLLSISSPPRGSAAAKLLRVPLLLSRPCCAVIKPQ
uniref:Uncharacterized protein n=1 Tax=Oryza nivara TaxID=4536 RepID=A0A0E0I8F4_ORYNI